MNPEVNKTLHNLPKKSKCADYKSMAMGNERSRYENKRWVSKDEKPVSPDQSGQGFSDNNQKLVDKNRHGWMDAIVEGHMQAEKQFEKYGCVMVVIAFFINIGLIIGVLIIYGGPTKPPVPTPVPT